MVNGTSNEGGVSGEPEHECKGRWQARRVIDRDLLDAKSQLLTFVGLFGNLS